MSLLDSIWTSVIQKWNQNQAGLPEFAMRRAYRRKRGEATQPKANTAWTLARRFRKMKSDDDASVLSPGTARRGAPAHTYLGQSSRGNDL